MSDVRDILELKQPPSSQKNSAQCIAQQFRMNSTPPMNIDQILAGKTKTSKKPQGMSREVYRLLYTDGKDPLPVEDVTNLKYQDVKAKFGAKTVRKWGWVPFANSARTDGVQFNHWRRIEEAKGDYPFARFNKKITVAQYTNEEYSQYLESPDWTREETDHLIDLCKRFDLRFIVIQDRYQMHDRKRRSVEDLKERYYTICNTLMKKNDPNAKVIRYNAQHERERKAQLEILYSLTKEEDEEIQSLMKFYKSSQSREKNKNIVYVVKNSSSPGKRGGVKLRRKGVGARKKLKISDEGEIEYDVPEEGTENEGDGSDKTESDSGISADGSNKNGTAASPPKTKTESCKGISAEQLATIATVGRKRNKACAAQQKTRSGEGRVVEVTGIKFQDWKTSGVSLLSSRMRLPATVGPRKVKIIEETLKQLNMQLDPIPTNETCKLFNKIRSDIVMKYDIEQAISSRIAEIEFFKEQCDILYPNDEEIKRIPDEVTQLLEDRRGKKVEE